MFPLAERLAVEIFPPTVSEDALDVPMDAVVAEREVTVAEGAVRETDDEIGPVELTAVALMAFADIAYAKEEGAFTMRESETAAYPVEIDVAVVVPNTADEAVIEVTVSGSGTPVPSGFCGTARVDTGTK